MKKFLSNIILIFYIILSTSNLFAEKLETGSAKGYLIVDNQKIEINYAYADEFDGDITVILSDNQIPLEMIPDDVYSLGEQGKMRGIVFSVSAETKQLQKDGLYKLINAIHFHPEWNQSGSIGNGVFSFTKFNSEIIEGKIVTISNNELDGHTFSYEILFSASLKKIPLKLNYTGDLNEPVKAFIVWGNALFSMDIDNYKKYSANEILQMLPEDELEMKDGLEFQQLMFPTQIELIESNIKEKTAELKFKGSKGLQSYKGTVLMIFEDGKWKVNEQSWE